jgi:NitT/TauT family transport system substrate-binding protein
VIATPQLGNTQDLAARAWFSSKGYRLKEKGGRVALVPLSNPDQLTLFKKKQIDGAWTIEPWVSRLQLEGPGRLFLDEADLWPQGRYVTTHLVVAKHFLTNNPALVKKLLEAHVGVTQQVRTNKVGAAKVLNEQLKRETGKALNPELMAQALSRVEFTWDPIASSLGKTAETALRVGILKKPAELKGIYSLELLNSVLKENGLPAVGGLQP